MSTSVRVMIFLDGSNLFWAKKYYNAMNKTDFKIDYSKLMEHLVAGRSLVRAIYYCSTPVPLTSPSQRAFLDYLRKSNIQVVEKELKTRTDSATGRAITYEKGVDVALATDLLGMAWENAFDVAILVSGDGDYVGAVDKVMSKGKNVEVVAFRGTCSSDLRRAAIRTSFIDDIAQLVKAA